jgi:hypothetical protein
MKLKQISSIREGKLALKSKNKIIEEVIKNVTENVRFKIMNKI